MACSCDCTDITIPTGSTGATGPQGPAGVNGVNGAAVLYNDVSNSLTTGTALQTCGDNGAAGLLKSYTLPAGTLDTDGSYLEIRASFITTTANLAVTSKFVGIYFNGNNITGTNYQIFYGSINKILIVARLNRSTNLLLKNEADVRGGYDSGGLTYLPGGSFNYFGGTMAVDLNNISYPITAKADGEAIGDITCEYMTITKFKK